MSLGLLKITDNSYLNYITQQNRAGNTSSSVGFTNVLSTKELESTSKTEMNFEEMWKAKFPGAYYHVMDASKIDQGLWERNDFPFEKFFQDEVDESILEWQPINKEPKMTDSSVQNRLNSTLGQKSIIVPPELEKKMKNDPELAKKVMANVENFIATYPTRPGRICSYLISLDENGEIAHFRVTGGGGLSGPSEEEVRQFKAEQKEKQEKAEEYRRILEETAEKRKENWQETNEEYYRKDILSKAIESYEKNTTML